jgi:hypothetical protein
MEAGMIGRFAEDKYIVDCPFDEMHTTGARYDSSTVVFLPNTPGGPGWFSCSHSHCKDRSQADVLAALPPEAIALARAVEQDVLPPDEGQGLEGLPHLTAVATIGTASIKGLALEPVRYVWDDIAMLGIIVLIAGGPGAGKTTLLFLILMARANVGIGVDVLGRAVTPAASGKYVVLIEGEHGPQSTARKLVRSCALLSVDEGSLDRVVLIARKSVRLGSPEWLDVVKLIGRGLVSDIALDTLARVAPGDANDEGGQVAIFDLIAQAIDRAPTPDSKPVVWVTAHTRKGGDGDDLESVSGSTQRTGQADTVLMVKAERRDGKVTSSKVTFAKLREDPDEYPSPVEFTVGQDALEIVTGVTIDTRPLTDRIVDRLRLGPKTVRQLREETKRNTTDVQAAIDLLFSAKRIKVVDLSVRGKVCKGLELVETVKVVEEDVGSGGTLPAGWIGIPGNLAGRVAGLRVGGTMSGRGGTVL